METMCTDNPGTTSAHAENTAKNRIIVVPIGNYLRARGEYFLRTINEPYNWELPPRTRRIQPEKATLFAEFGTTSAHAENTMIRWPYRKCSRNYLRARGEYPGSVAKRLRFTELPPRTRRIHSPIEWGVQNFGTTSAHAENTIF